MNAAPAPDSPASANQDKSWAGKKLTLGWIIGIIALVVFSGVCSWQGTKTTGINAALVMFERGIKWPAFIVILFSAFSYFRKAPRRLAVVAMVAFGLFGVFYLSISLQKRMASGPTAVMTEEWTEIKRQIVYARDRKAQEDAAQRAVSMLQNAPDKMSTKQDADGVRALVKFMEPSITQARTLFSAKQDFLGDAPDTDWVRKYTDTKETLALGRERLARIIQLESAEPQMIDSIIEKASTIIKNNDTSLGIPMEALKNFYSSYAASAQSAKNINKISIQGFSRMDDALAMLQTGWDQWSKNSDGKIVWNDDELSKKYKIIFQDIDTLRAQLTEQARAALQ